MRLKIRSLSFCSQGVEALQEAGLLSVGVSGRVGLGRLGVATRLTVFDVPDRAEGGAGLQGALHLT